MAENIHHQARLDKFLTKFNKIDFTIDMDIFGASFKF